MRGSEVSLILVQNRILMDHREDLETFTTHPLFDSRGLAFGDCGPLLDDLALVHKKKDFYLESHESFPPQVSSAHKYDLNGINSGFYFLDTLGIDRR